MGRRSAHRAPQTHADQDSKIGPPPQLGQRRFHYCGGIDQVISSPDCTPNGSLVTGRPEPRTGRASNVTEAAPPVTGRVKANVTVSPPGANPSR